MSTRREDGRPTRIPSPIVTRRQIRSHDGQTLPTEDHYFDPRLLGRESSPRSISRLPMPSGETHPSLHSRGYRSQRSMDLTDGNLSQDTPGSNHVASSPFRYRELSPRKFRTLSAPAGYFVNGEATALQSSRGRPQSSIGATYLSDPSSQLGYGLDPKRRDVSPGYRGQGQVNEDRMEGSSNGDEAMSSVTTSADGMPKSFSSTLLGSEMMEGSFTCDDGYTWHTVLTCYVCGQLFRRPRILPCGHTFCSECLVQLKDESLREGKKLPEGHSACSQPNDTRNKTDITVQFVCPIPECRYAMRLINLSRWSTRNKTVTEVVTAYRRMYESRQDASTQTDITNNSVLVTIPRSFIQESPISGSERGLSRCNSSTLVDRMVHRALSMDSLSRNYIPQRHVTWRSYAAMLGMQILQQVIHT